MNWPGVTTLSFFSLFLVSCSTAMMWAGHPDPQISRFSTGMCRSQLQHAIDGWDPRAILGQPTKIEMPNGKLIETYRLERNNTQETWSKGLGNLGLGIVSGGLWELIGSYIQWHKPIPFDFVIEYTKRTPPCKDQQSCPCEDNWAIERLFTVDKQ